MLIDENEIFKSAYENNSERIKQLYNLGVDINKPHPRSGHIPLQAACETNALVAIKTLLFLGADPNCRFTKVSRVDGHIICNNSTPLMEVRSIEAANLLIEAGADYKLFDNNKMTPIDWAKKRELIQVVEFLESLK